MPADAAAAHKLELVQPSPKDAHRMPYAPAVKIVGACDLMFVSGATPSPATPSTSPARSG